ncbi:MAG: hypothetical protein KKC51_13580 [Verrucomicrobia bacterium]|nr:hypothetical protein [Verrucomicrobiota bacterium]
MISFGWPMSLAYIDPGTGGMILQLVMAALVGAGLFFRRSIARVFSIFLRKKSDPDDKSKGTS